MKPSELIITRQTRASSAEEQDYLQHLLLRAITPRKRYLKAILNTLVMWGFTLLGFLMASGLISYFAKNNQTLNSLMGLPNITVWLIIISGAYATFSTYRWLQRLENPYPLLVEDINTAQLLEETYRVEAFSRFQEPELGGYLYCLKISEQDVFVIYDYHSQGDSDSFLKVKETLILSRAPASGYVLNYRFSGKSINCQATLPLTLPPEKWPLPDQWIAIAWSDLTAHLSK